MIDYKCPSSINYLFKNIPCDIQKEALEVMIEECKRIQSGKFTAEEIKFMRLSKSLGKSSAKTVENIAERVFRKFDG